MIWFLYFLGILGIAAIIAVLRSSPDVGPSHTNDVED